MTPSPAHFGRHLAVTVGTTGLFNTAIALLLWTVGFGGTFVQNLIFSQCIGLSICLAIVAALHLIEPDNRWTQAITVLSAMLAGSVFGTLAGAALTGGSPLALELVRETSVFLRIVGVGMLMGTAVGYFFYSRYRLESSAALFQQERIKRLSSEKLALTAELKRLQAQIEPHFLFNTLSTVHSLMDQDLEQAKAMQLNLIRYLRTALQRTRSQATTLGQEVALVRAYLEIYKIRMGDRLDYTLRIPDELAGTALPPLLLQPLVENALIHGLEPRIDGGTIVVQAAAEDDRLRIDVSDTGCGLADNQSPGIGLTNITRRLEQLYGDRARMLLRPQQPSGVAVTIEVPLCP